MLDILRFLRGSMAVSFNVKYFQKLMQSKCKGVGGHCVHITKISNKTKTSRVDRLKRYAVNFSKLLCSKFGAPMYVVKDTWTSKMSGKISNCKVPWSSARRSP